MPATNTFASMHILSSNVYCKMGTFTESGFYFQTKILYDRQFIRNTRSTSILARNEQSRKNEANYLHWWSNILSIRWHSGLFEMPRKTDPLYIFPTNWIVNKHSTSNFAGSRMQMHDTSLHYLFTPDTCYSMIIKFMQNLCDTSTHRK